MAAEVQYAQRPPALEAQTCYELERQRPNEEFDATQVQLDRAHRSSAVLVAEESRQLDDVRAVH